MFGTSAFAATPFAALLTGNIFVVSFNEDITLADSSSQVTAFLQALAENARRRKRSMQTGGRQSTILTGSGTGSFGG